VIELLDQDPEVERWVRHFAMLLGLESESAWVTTSRSGFEKILGRRVGASIGGAYIYLPRRKRHLILINLPRLNPDEPRATELVVAEELIHMRDCIDGDTRRHSKHGYDRIAHRVAQIATASLEEVRNCLAPTTRRPYKWVYACPGCGITVYRKRKGTWSCARCSPTFDRRYVLKVVGELEPANLN
jgi:hypothetical protein